MSKDNIFINKALQKQIIEHCKKGYPKEACGILAGKDNRAEILYTLENISRNPESCYEIDSRETLRITKELRSKSLSLVAIYHSHTNSPAYPSSYDVELAFYPDSFYVIASLEDRNNSQIRAFKIIEEEIKEAHITS